MNFRLLARAKLSNLLLRKSPTMSSDPFDKVIKSLIEETTKEELTPLIEFAKEYHGTVDYLFGYLFEPYGDLLKLSPLLKKSKNPRSPYFCLKIPVKDMGNIFLIPLSSSSSYSYALVLKPNRLYRKPIELQNLIFEPLLITPQYYPYPELIEKLVLWATTREASKLV